MVCSTEQSAKSYLEAVWIKAGTFKKYWADDWMSHMSITGYFVTKSTNHEVVNQTLAEHLSIEKGLQCCITDTSNISSTFSMLVSGPDLRAHPNIYDWLLQ